ncbi:N-acetylmuramoyl-L-alanine amidase [Nocardia sp. 2]|uniref:N-acetylmuramoyl-L-alanine amidase n=2 Tax=Nocardia acididurans TaxID=2802282 RepID=A0ABS1M1W0_9NOCA|nr:N-acetylmuramoyl-L-alanine amidase [Nocardia acididurans]
MAAICGALLIGGSGQMTASAQDEPARTQVPFARTVVIDPGHNGGGAAQPEVINASVPDGRGGSKSCNTTGTSADDGYTEHEFNWDVATRVRDLLTLRGYRVVMTRDNDAGAGPCVNDRGTLGQRVGAAAVVSIHADGAPAGAHGFHVAYSNPPLNAAQGEPSVRLATSLRDSLVRSGFVPSTYVGSEGLNPRPDLAGLNFSEVPAALVECGNMRDPGDIDILRSPEGRARIAEAITNAIAGYVG